MFILIQRSTVFLRESLELKARKDKRTETDSRGNDGGSFANLREELRDPAESRFKAI